MAKNMLDTAYTHTLVSMFSGLLTGVVIYLLIFIYRI